MSRCDLDRWLVFSLTLKVCGRWGVTLSLPQTVTLTLTSWPWSCVVPRLSRNFKFGHYLLMVLMGANWGGHRAIIANQDVCFRVKISCCILKRGRVKGECCQKWSQISFAGGVTEISEWKIKLHLWSNFWYTFDGRPVRGWWEPSLSKKREKESSSVNLKAFRHTYVGTAWIC